MLIPNQKGNLKPPNPHGRNIERKKLKRIDGCSHCNFVIFFLYRLFANCCAAINIHFEAFALHVEKCWLTGF
jgi:hypothetical protein